MATYNYTALVDGSRTKGYVDFNLSPAPGQITIGSKLTISGRVYSRDVAIKSIRAFFGTELADAQLGSLEFAGAVGYVNKTIAKATQATFSMSVTITRELWEYLRERYSDWPEPGNPHTVQIIEVFFDLCPTTANASVLHGDIGDYKTPAGTAETHMEDYISAHTFSVADPVGVAIDATAVTDTAGVSALTALGNLVTGHSRPRISAGWALDPDYFIQPCSHSLALTGAMTGTYTANTGGSARSVNFDLPAPAQAGTVYWTYTVTDMFGNSDAESGSFAVLAYYPPGIADFTLERYADVIDGGGHSHEVADDGELAWLSLIADVAAVNGRNAWVATFAAWPVGTQEPAAQRGAGAVRDTSGAVYALSGWSLGGGEGAHLEIARDEALLTGFAPSAAVGWLARITIEDALGNSATLVCDDIGPAGAVLDVEPWGIGIGMRSTGRQNALDPVTGEVTEVRQAVDVAEDWALRVRGPMAVAAGQLLKVVTVTCFSSESIAAGAIKSDTAGVSPGTGWTPVCVVGHSATGSSGISLYRLRLTGSGVEYGVRNITTGSITPSLAAYVLCLRTGM